jgi:hypothetical protein
MSKYGKQVERDGIQSDFDRPFDPLVNSTAGSSESVDDYKTTIETRYTNQFAADMWEIFDSAGNLLLKKHEAYGSKNIGGAPGGPENGLRVRMWDKIARLNNIIDNPSVDVNDEALEDTLQDLLNYCAIFIMVRRGQWPAE